MRHCPMFLSVFVFLIMGKSGEVFSQAAVELDYRKVAEGADWRWDEKLADPLHAGLGSKDYDVRFDYYSAQPNVIVISISKDGKVLYSWSGHRYSVFQIVENKLYFADFPYLGTNTKIVAIDLQTGKEIWRSPLKAATGVLAGSSGNLALLNLDVQGEVINIFGKENDVRYFEIKKVSTGETVGHKIFPREAAAIRIGQ